jgi:hypothetical protein
MILTLDLVNFSAEISGTDSSLDYTAPDRNQSRDGHAIFLLVDEL